MEFFKEFKIIIDYTKYVWLRFTHIDLISNAIKGRSKNQRKIIIFGLKLCIKKIKQTIYAAEYKYIDIVQEIQ